jgi:hypothetical protein
MELSGESDTTAALPRERTPVHIAQEAGYTPEPVRTFGKIYISSHAGVRTLDRPVRSIVPVLTAHIQEVRSCPLM